MKKILALVLAVMMMATVAFATDATLGNAGSGTAGTADATPGGKILVYIDAFDSGDASNTPLDGTLTSEYFSIAKKTWDKGGSLIKEVKFNDAKERIEIILKDDYTLETPDDGKFNLIIKALEIKCKKDTGTNAEKRKTYGLLDSVSKELLIGWDVATVDISASNPTLTLGTINKMDGNDTVAYETVSFELPDAAYAEGRVYDGDKYFVDGDTNVDTDIVKKYPDADLEFVNLKNSPSFNSNFDLEVYADEDSYIYEVKDGKLVASSLKWDDDAYAFTGRVRTLGTYVISDTKLNVSAAADTGNPDTGANDVVGIATALAAVALVSAAAVSLKK